LVLAAALLLPFQPLPLPLLPVRPPPLPLDLMSPEDLVNSMDKTQKRMFRAALLASANMDDEDNDDESDA